MAKTCRRVKGAIFNPSSPFVQMLAADLSNYVMPSTMVNLVHTTPALTATIVSYVQCHMQESTVKCEDKNKVQSIQPNPHKTPTICQLPSLVNPKSLTSFLINYDRVLSSYLINGFTYDFKLGCTSDLPPCTPQSHKSTLEHPDIIKNYIHTGLSKGPIAGPFSYKSFDNFVVSPLGLVPKGNTRKFRVIHDLSFPKNHLVNSNIPQESSAVQYDSIDEVVSLVRMFGRGCLMVKTDIEDAFRIIPIHSSDYHLLGSDLLR